MKNKNNELKFKSKLLFNSLDMAYKSVLDLSLDSLKRNKSLDKLFSTYTMSLNPFIVDEPKEYQTSVYTAIKDKHTYLSRLIDSGVTVEYFVFILSPMLNSLKGMVSTCKLNLDEVNKLWEIL